MLLKAEKEYERERDKEKGKASAKSLGLIRGLNIRHLINTKEVVIGRTTTDKNVKVDVDLLVELQAREYHRGKTTTIEDLAHLARQISRFQSIIQLKSNGNFYIRNIGKHIMFVNGCELLPSQKRLLNHNSLIQIGAINLVFEINKTLWNKIKRQSNQ